MNDKDDETTDEMLDEYAPPRGHTAASTVLSQLETAGSRRWAAIYWSPCRRGTP
jgi:hypothetical protein